MRPTATTRLPEALMDPDLVAVGAAVAGLHAAAPVEPDGGVERIAAVIEETVATLATAGAPSRRLEDLSRFCGAALMAFGPELANRAEAGLVREGHGEPRIADVGYDLAFLIMDVARRDDDLARALLRGYRAAGGDPGSEALIAFFCTLRALVGAKVDFLRAEQLTGAAADDRTLRALELFAVAERFAWRARLPRVICVTGLAASGKSTVAEALAASAGRTVLSSDRIRKLRAGIDPYEHAAPSAYDDAASHAVYAELALRAAGAVRRDGGAIVDATFRRASDADAFAATSPTAAGAAWIVCEAPLEVRLERARAREFQATVSDAGPAIVAAELARFGRPFLAPAPPLARLDTTEPIVELLAELSEVLDAQLRTSGPWPRSSAADDRPMTRDMSSADIPSRAPVVVST